MTQTVTITSIGKLKTPAVVSLSKHISAPAEKVWEILSTPGHLLYCHPFCEKNPVDKWPGVGSEDAVYFYSGKVAYRHFNEWLEGVGYDITVDEGTQANVTFRIRRFEEISESELTMTVKIDALPTIPRGFRFLFSHLILHPLLRKYIDSLLKGYEYYITTGQAVKRNQFGSHPIYSPAINWLYFKKQ